MAHKTPIPGLNKCPTEEDLEKSRNIYNRLPDDSQQPQLSKLHIHELAALFVRNRADGVFGIHLAHGHFALPEKTVLLGVNYDAPHCRWANATAFDKLDLESVHGHIFVLTDTGFHPYEYQAGPAPDLSKVDDGFLGEFARYLSAHNLTKLIGLQLLDTGMSITMFELILPQGTIMLDAAVAEGCEPTRQTGWAFEDADGGARERKSTEVHARHAKGHEVFNAGKPLPKLEAFEDVKHALVQQNILRSYG